MEVCYDLVSTSKGVQSVILVHVSKPNERQTTADLCVCFNHERIKIGYRLKDGK